MMFQLTTSEAEEHNSSHHCSLSYLIRSSHDAASVSMKTGRRRMEGTGDRSCRESIQCSCSKAACYFGFCVLRMTHSLLWDGVRTLESSGCGGDIPLFWRSPRVIASVYCGLCARECVWASSCRDLFPPTHIFYSRGDVNGDAFELRWKDFVVRTTWTVFVFSPLR